jgi:hypothetical protein
MWSATCGEGAGRGPPLTNQGSGSEILDLSLLHLRETLRLPPDFLFGALYIVCTRPFPWNLLQRARSFFASIQKYPLA